MSNCNLQGRVPQDAAYNHLVACQSTIGALNVGGVASMNNLLVNNLVVNKSFIGPFTPPPSTVETAAPLIGDGSFTDPVTLTPGITNGDILQWNNGMNAWDIVPLSLDSALPVIGDGTSVNPLTITPGTNTGDTLVWNSGTSSWNIGTPPIVSATPVTGTGTVGNPVTLTAGTTNGDILQWNSGTTTWDIVPLTVDTALPIIGTGTSGNPVTLTPGINNGDTLVWNSGTTSWDVTTVPPSGALTASPLTGNGVIGSPITFSTGSSTSNAVQWNSGINTWSLARSPGTTEVTVGPGSGALYADVATALAAGSALIRVIGNTTEPSTLTIATNTIIYIDPGVTYTTNNTITVTTGTLLILGNSAQNSIWSYNSAGGAIISATTGQDVSFRQIQIVNNSTVGSTPIVTATANIFMQSVLVTLPSGLANTFLGDNTTIFTRLFLQNVQVVGNNSGVALQCTTDTSTGEIQVNSLTLAGTWSGTVIDAVQSRAAWRTVLYSGTTAATFNLQGTIEVFKALNGSGAVTLNVSEQTASGSPPMVMSDINLGTTVSSILALTITSAVGTTSLQATNVVVNRCVVSGPNISIANMYCLFMNPTGVGDLFKLANAQCAEFTTTLTLASGSELVNITTNGTTGSSPFATIVTGTNFVIRNWVQTTGRLQIDTASYSSVSGVYVGTSTDPSAGMVVNNCTYCRFSDIYLEQGILLSSDTNCSVANINLGGTGSTTAFVMSGSNNRVSQLTVFVGTCSITGQGHYLANCNIPRTTFIGTSAAACTDCVITNCIIGSVTENMTLDGPTGTTVARHIFANNQFVGVVIFGGAAGRIVTSCIFEGNRFASNTSSGITITDAACSNHKLISNMFTGSPFTPTYSAPDWQFLNNMYENSGTVTVSGTAVRCVFVGNRYTSGTTINITAMAAGDRPLFVGNLNSAAGTITGPTNSHANSTGNT